MSSVKLSDQIYAGFTDDILKSLTVGITTDKSDSSISCVKTSDSTPIIGASHTFKSSVSSPSSLSIAGDSKTGVLIKSSHTITHSTPHSSFSASASAGYNFGTRDSVGVVSSVDVSHSSKFGDKFTVSSDLSSFVDISAKRDSIVGRYSHSRQGTSEIGVGYENRGKNVGIGISRDGFSFSFGYSM